jgi:predicted ATP-grasp superfamily ATP-dependent carboligase
LSERFVHIVDDVPELTGVTPVLVVVLHGFLDAGNASGLAADHLEQLGGGKVVATFDIDAFYDYRARRPPLSFVRDHYERYDAPRLTVRLMQDAAGAPYLLLRGPEPDTYWEAFARCVREVMERFHVSKLVTLAGVPMAVPHTRPIAITPHASRRELLPYDGQWEGELRIPSSAQSLTEVRLGEWGLDAMGFVAHVPHYIAQLDYPRAAIALLDDLASVTGLRLATDGLRSDAEETESEIARYLADNDEVAQVVAGLEQQYDSFQRAEQSGTSLLADNEPLPTGEEIGAQFERFLAGLDDTDDES